MAYVIQAFLARSGTFGEEIAGRRRAIIVPLAQDIEMLLNTDEFFDSFKSTESDEDSLRSEFFHLSANLEQFFAMQSERGAIAYIEAEYFGGVGSQAAIVWKQGKVVLGPLGNMQSESTEIGPINSALRFLGVVRIASDEFDAVGLGKHRFIEDWEKSHR